MEKKQNNVNITVEYKNIKTMNIRVVSATEVIVRANPAYTKKQIQDFIDSKQDWIRKQLVLRRQQEELRNEGVFVFGKRYDVRQVMGESNEIQFMDSTIHVIHRPTKDANEVLRKELGKLIQKTLLERLDACMGCFLKLTKPNIVVKAMKAHWGICKYRESEVVLNAHLVHVPMSCIDYVIVHELMHFYFPDHQAGFHAGMKQAMPDYRERRKKLREYEFLLRR